MAAAKFSPGFRFSALDGVVLVIGVVGVVAVSVIEWWLGLAVGIPLAAFFVFCNVFRVSRPLELLWAGAFIALVAATILWGVPGWWATALGSALVAAVAVAAEMRRPSYHGVGWRHINPGLPSWWKARAARAQGAELGAALDRRGT
jgi:hypothetical protein